MTNFNFPFILISYFPYSSRKEVFVINKFFNIFFTLILILTIFISIFFIPNYSNTSSLLWPAPGIIKINSYFGKRKAPTSGASSFHKGIDIAAPQNYEFIAVTNGTITFTGFLGGGGYTITLTDESLSNGEIKYSYCHVDPNFFVSVGDNVLKGQVIGKVGPKYVGFVKGNIYTDINRKTNKWSHNWAPLTFWY